MRLHVISDLHLERAEWRPARAPEADVVVVAGDVHRGLKGIQWVRACYGDRPVVYVPGNHEFHRHSFPGLWERIRDRGRARGVHVLEQECVEIRGTRFYGATLWTDFALFGDEQRERELASREMSDYDRVRFDPAERTLEPRDTLAVHRRTRAWLQAEADAGRTRGAVIVTHHAPSERCLRPEKREDRLSACYASHLDALVASTRAALWVYGHTHWSRDFRIGGVRMLSNQRGYPGEDTHGFDEGLVVEV